MGKKMEAESPTKIWNREPDDKTRAVELLRNKGYDSWLKDGVVLCAKESETTFEEITKILQESGYRASYGIGRRKEDK